MQRCPSLSNLSISCFFVRTYPNLPTQSPPLARPSPLACSGFCQQFVSPNPDIFFPTEKISGGENMAEPEHIRVGAIDITIWTNDGSNGSYRTVTINRSYKDASGTWQKSQTFRANDIPKVILGLQRAYESMVIR